MDTDEWARRGSSFGAVAAAYARFRPGYPADAVAWCVAPAGRPAVGLRVLDLGAGTGKLTALLAGLGADVTAVERDQAMLAELRRSLPSVRAMAGAAEAIPLPDGSVDAVLCAQSIHWFDLSRAVPEIARVLVPGGVLGALWNSDDDRVPWVAGLRDVARGAGSPVLSERNSDAIAFGAEQFGRTLFTPTERADFSNPQPRTIDSLIDDLRTHSAVLILRDDERERRLGEIRVYLESRSETGQGAFELPMVTSALRSVRRLCRLQGWLPRPSLRLYRRVNCTTRPCTGRLPMPTSASCGSWRGRSRRRRRSRGMTANPRSTRSKSPGCCRI